MTIELTCLMGVMDETYSLRHTIETLHHRLVSEAFEIVISVSPYTSNDSLEVLKDLVLKYKNILVLKEKDPGIGGAYRTAIEGSSGKFLVLMSSDLETDPSLVPILLEEKKRSNSADIICVSRWIKKDAFSGYSLIQLLLNSIFQKLVRLVTGTAITDFTYAFRIYDASQIRDLEFKELRHGFFLESLLLPMSRGARISEIPGSWMSRSEGIRHIKVWDYFSYVRVLGRFARQKYFRGK